MRKDLEKAGSYVFVFEVFKALFASRV